MVNFQLGALDAVPGMSTKGKQLGTVVVEYTFRAYADREPGTVVINARGSAKLMVRESDCMKGLPTLSQKARKDAAPAGLSNGTHLLVAIFPNFQHRQKRLLRNINAPDALHALLAFLLLF